MGVNTAYVNHTDVLEIPEDTALYLTQEKLAGMHYQEIPVTTRKEDFESLSGDIGDSSGKGTFESFYDYVDNDTVLGIRNNIHPELKGGLMAGSVSSPRPRVDSIKKPMGIVVTLSDPDDPTDKIESKIERLRKKTSDIGPAESVLADIPLDKDLSGQKILNAARNQQVNPKVIEFLEKLVDTDGNSEFEALGEKFKLNDGSLKTIYVFQVIRLNPDDTRWVWYRDYPFFGSINHRGTTNGWNTGSEQLLAAYAGVNKRSEIRDINWIESDFSESDLISDDELETLCSEFLRQGLFTEGERMHETDPYGKYAHTYPVGGSLQSVDIVAEDVENERPILAQVTFESEAVDKVNDLASAITQQRDNKDVAGWFFGKDAQTAVNNAETGDIEPVEIDEVLKAFSSSTERTQLNAIWEGNPDQGPPAVLQGNGRW